MKAIESGKRITSGHSQPGAGHSVLPRLAKSTGKKYDNVVWVRYKSGKETTVALLGGHVDLIIGNPMDIAPQVQDRRAAHARLGQPGPLASAARRAHHHRAGQRREHRFLVGPSPLPRATDPAKVAKLQAAFKTAVESKNIQKKMIDLGMAPKFMTGAEYGKFCVEGKKQMGEDLAAIGIKKKK